MILGLDYIIITTILLILLIPLYIYRKKIIKKFTKESDNDSFVKDITIYLKTNYPKFVFDFTIINKYSNEPNFKTQQVLIIEDLIKQFIKKEFVFSTQKNVEKKYLWLTYEENSRLKKDNKLPTDWIQRKNAALKRDKNKCNRCQYTVSTKNSHALLIKQMKDGGGFNFENIVILCNDCNRIIKSNYSEKIYHDLHIMDELLNKIHK